MKKSFLFCLFIFGLVAVVPNVSASGEGWLDGWDYRQGYTVTNSTGAGNNYQVWLNVTYDSEMQNDFDDLRFTDDNGATELDYWIENYTASSFALVWVEVADNLNTTQEIYMYYGNSGVSTTSNGDETFLFFDDFNGATLDHSKWNNTHGTEGDDYEVSGGFIDFLDAADERVNIFSYDNWTGNVAFAWSLYWESTWQFINIGPTQINTTTGLTEAEGDRCIYETRSADSWVTEDDGGNDHTETHTAAVYVWSVQSVYYYGSSHLEIYEEYSELYDYTSGIPDEELHACFATLDTDTTNRLMLNWTFVRSLVENEPVANLGCWIDVDEAEFFLPVHWNPIIQFGYDAFFIFLGLIMIPVSTMYLVRGGRKEMSTDKIFFGLIIFAVGIAFLIGGIMP